MRIRRLFITIPTLLIIIILFACSRKDSEVVVNSAVKIDSESRTDGSSNSLSGFYTEKLVTTSAASKIRFVDKEQEKFWNKINYNHIDEQYNNTKILKDNIRIQIKANEKYMDKWLEELSKTYDYIEDEFNNKSLYNNIKKQYKAFMRYYENSKALYQGIIVPENNYDGIIDGTDTIRQMYSLADDVREYTILLKEYIYLYNKEIDFYTEKDDVRYKKDNIYTNNEIDINIEIVNNDKFEDIIKDYYGKKIKYSVEKLDRGSNEEIIRYKDYWNVELNKNYKNIVDIFNYDDKNILKIQKDSYKEYIKYSLDINEDILDEAKNVHFKYKEDIDVENLIFEAQYNMKYNILLVEYYYLMTNKIDV